jgi:hypothetical protein
LAVKGVEQGSTDLLGCDRQIIETISSLAGQRRWRHIQVSGEIQGHSAVQEGTYSFYGLGCRDIDPFERLVDGVREGEKAPST